jgi:hypothetical protein
MRRDNPILKGFSRTSRIFYYMAPAAGASAVP